MELTHDWRTLNNVLFSSQGTATGLASDLSGKTKEASSVVLLEDKGQIIEGLVSNGTPFRGVENFDHSKASLDAISKKYDVDKTVVFSKKDLDQYVIEASTIGTNYYQQLQSLRERLNEQVKPLVSSRSHFILDFFSGRIHWLLPRKFNILVFIDKRDSFTVSNTEKSPPGFRAILLNYNRGKLDQFYEPDFSSLPTRRLVEWTKSYFEIGQYLESRYILPCYCLFMYEDVWRECQQASVKKWVSPWSYFVKSFDEMRAVIYPTGIIAKTLLAVQRLIVYFSRL